MNFEHGPFAGFIIGEPAPGLMTQTSRIQQPKPQYSVILSGELSYIL
jgi:hypothetical protein